MKRFMSILLSGALVMPIALTSVGCDDEIAHEERTVQNPDGTGSKTETTVKEKSDGSIEKTTEKKVDNTPDR